VASLNLTSIVASGDFSQTNNCGNTLVVNASCIISVSFAPTTSGPRSGAVTLTDDAGDSPQNLSLGGNGIAPFVSLAPPSLTFPDQPVGTTSSPMNVLLTNTGTAALNISSVTTTGDFAQTNDCGAVVGPGASCTISVTFTPSQVGPASGSVVLSDDASGSPQLVGLSGNGT